MDLGNLRNWCIKKNNSRCTTSRPAEGYGRILLFFIRWFRTSFRFRKVWPWWRCTAAESDPLMSSLFCRWHKNTIVREIQKENYKWFMTYIADSAKCDGGQWSLYIQLFRRPKNAIREVHAEYCKGRYEMATTIILVF